MKYDCDEAGQNLKCYFRFELYCYRYNTVAERVRFTQSQRISPVLAVFEAKLCLN